MLDLRFWFHLTSFTFLPPLGNWMGILPACWRLQKLYCHLLPVTFSSAWETTNVTPLTCQQWGIHLFCELSFLKAFHLHQFKASTAHLKKQLYLITMVYNFRVISRCRKPSRGAHIRLSQQESNLYKKYHQKSSRQEQGRFTVRQAIIAI